MVDAATPDHGTKSYSAPFRIEAYRKPIFEVRVTSASLRACQARMSASTSSAEMFEGGPLAKAPFTWSFVWNRVDRDLFPTDELARLFFGTEREALAPETLATGEGVLDATGKARVNVKAARQGPGRLPHAARDGHGARPRQGSGSGRRRAGRRAR